MGLVNSALQIGRSALQSYQSALQVVGNNISNAGNADYTRQSVGMSAIHGSPLAEGMQPGAGVALTELKRNLDESLENRLRAAIGDVESAVARQQALSEVEAFFDETTGTGLSSKLAEFFHGFADVQNSPTDLGVREITLAQGTALADTLSDIRDELKALGDEIDGQIADLVVQADELAGKIAELNAEITAAEAGSQDAAHALRDQRDGLLRDLSEIFDVSVRHQADGSIYVYAGSEPLILGGVSRGLTTDRSTDGEFARTTVHFADGSDTGSRVPVQGGRLDGLIQARDTEAYGRLSSIDELAGAIIYEVNRIHSEGQGLTGFSSVTGSYTVQDTTAALDSSDAGMDFAPTNGSFYVALTDDATGTVVAYQVEVDLDGTDDDTTLDSLVADINATVDGLAASVTADNRLQLEADDGYSFSFGHDGEGAREDTAGVLAALGINTFFEGTTAADMRVNEVLEGSPAMLAASSVNFPGDGSNAGRLAQVASTPSDALNGVSVTDGYNRVANDVAVAGGAALDQVESANAVHLALQSQKESISGVNLDEETLELLKFERAYQGAARYVTTVDQMMNELLALVS